MEKTEAIYTPLVGKDEGAKKFHIHVTELSPAGEGWASQHTHTAEEAIYILEGEAEFTFDGETHRIGPGDAIFFPSGVLHAETRFFSDTMKYLVIRSVEPDDDTCCCGKE